LLRFYYQTGTWSARPHDFSDQTIQHRQTQDTTLWQQRKDEWQYRKTKDKDRDEEQGKKAKRRGMNRKKPASLIAMIKKLLLFVKYNG
jgi:hypothetical protein